MRELYDRLLAHRGATGEAKAAYELLSKRARKNLEERAERYGAATGKTIAPEQMIAPAHFVPRFEPSRTTAEIRKPHALVVVYGATEGEVARVPCVFEETGWRVDVLLPPLPPVIRLPSVE